MQNEGALAGIRVLDLTQFLAGPYCTMLLGDLGAEVIKVERIEFGEDNRRMGEIFLNGMSALFLGLNRSKKSISVDLKSARGKAIFRQLVEKADVVVENFRPGTMEGLGLGYEELKVLNPKLIYAKISGWGNTGPYASKGGFDLIMQAEAGLLSITGEEHGRPCNIPLHLVDTNTGTYTALGIVSALFARLRTGLGQFVETALFNTAVGWAIGHITVYYASGNLPMRMGTADRLAAPQQAFKTSDGWMVFSAPSQALWEVATKAIGIEHLLTDSRFATNKDRVAHREALVEEIEKALSSFTTEIALQKLDAVGIPCGRINSMSEAFAHPQAQHNKAVIHQDHPTAGPIKLPAVPISLSATPTRISSHAPKVGEQTSPLLKELLAMPDEEIAELLKSRVVFES